LNCCVWEWIRRRDGAFRFRLVQVVLVVPSLSLTLSRSLARPAKQDLRVEVWALARFRARVELKMRLKQISKPTRPGQRNHLQPLQGLCSATRSAQRHNFSHPLTSFRISLMFLHNCLRIAAKIRSGLRYPRSLGS